MKHFWWIIFILFCCGCRPVEPDVPAERAFYFWRSDFSLSPAETQALKNLGISTLYTRFFDVVWDGNAAVPVAQLSFNNSPPEGVRIIPTVFLRNEVFVHTNSRQAIDRLTARVLNRIRSIAAPQNLLFREIQIDCDWTGRTKDAFFTFLKALKKETSGGQISISATIRLHQIKYRERTGVPPVNRGMLMFYNMGPIDADPDTHAIFDKEIASQYLARLSQYPIPLDATLPIWSWTVHLRKDRVVDLLQQTDAAALQSAKWLRPVGKYRYEATENSFIAGKMIRKGDLLEAETIGPKETETAARTLLDAMGLSKGKAFGRVALFSLSERNLRCHDDKSLKNVLSLFR